MFCKTCGEKCPSLGNYCLNDGTYFSQERVDFKLNGKRKFCQDCGTEGGSGQNYCLSCGADLKLYTKKAKHAYQEPSNKEQATKRKSPTTPVALPKFSLENLKLAIIPAFISIVILTVISFGVLSMSQSYVTDLLLTGDSELSEITEFLGVMGEETDANVPDLSNIIGLTDIMMYSTLQGSTFEFEATSSDGVDGSTRASIDLPNGTFLYILIPFVSLFIGGTVLGARNRDKQGSLLGLNLSMAVIVAVILAIVSIFAGFSYKAKMASEFFNVNIQMANNYSFIGTLLISFLFALVFGGLGVLFSRNYRKITGHLPDLMPYGVAVHQAFSTMVRGMTLLFVVFTVYFATKVHELKDSLGMFLAGSGIETLLEKSSLFVVSLSAQLSNYVWNLLHGAPFHLTAKDDGEEMSLGYSIFKGLTSSGEQESEIFFLQQMLEGSSLGLSLKIALLLPILLFVWAGYQMAKGHENQLKQVAVFSLVYSICMGGLAHFTDLSFAVKISETGYGSEEVSASLGFSGVGVLIRSFIVAFFFSYAGTWVRKLKS
ncbi:zinc ribbon domain-containing protein [Mesobacillus maritimus]|uniref:Zinc ribbon domain-containing protein n=1 Tax=Mesobacillus maritimus TaxID=1643336 RepID=A0ABS7K543_9BACI|nr:zinc ribbon domain-containing protein [Mesobacillus maritimus]MBY0097261.1 zinc ribbon domain-containing protein [Mesobacillus maritimus]